MSTFGGVQSPNSSVKGILQSIDTPLDDGGLDDFFQELIQSLTNLPKTLVRPAFQPFPGTAPEITVDWVAFNIQSRKDELIPSSIFDETGLTLIRGQELSVNLSFYGPNNDVNESRYRDGLSIEQNRYILKENGFAFINHSEVKNMAMMVKDRWQKRVDVLSRFRRTVTRTYPILSIISGVASVQTENGIEQIVVNP